MADSATMTPALRVESETSIERFNKIFASLAVRHGIKFGLAGVLSLFVALLLRLPEPTWAVMTVFVIMFAQFVGAVAEKAVMRVIGTVIGGVIGYLLTARFEQQPVLYLLLVGGVVGFGTAMFGYTKYPYAFLLCALTTMVVASNGMSDPSFSWRPALARIEEVSVGVISAVLVSSLIWPRYARKEFLEKMRLALGELSKGLTVRSALLFNQSIESMESNERSFATAVAGLQNLLHFGAMESQYFRARLPTFTEIITCLNRISAAVETLVQTLPEQAIFRQHLRAELEAAHAATAACLSVFADPDADSSSRASALSEANARSAQWREKLHALRQTDVAAPIPVEQVLQFAGHALSVREVVEQLGKLNALLGSLPTNPLQPSREAVSPPSPPLDPFWIRNGVKACIAVTLGLFIQNWLQPPGGSMIALATWVTTVLSRLYPGGQGDRRAFHCVVYTASGGLLYVVAMLFLTPALSSYLIFNMLLFVTLFLFGYLTQTVPGVTFTMQIALLATVGAVGLNAQEPVTFQTIMGVYFGIVLGLVLSALVQRLLWPVLPQWQFRDRVIELLRLCRAILQFSPEQRPHWLHQRLALIPGEAANWIAVMNKWDCPPGEPQRLREYVQTLSRAAGHLLMSTGQLVPLLPAEQAQKGHEALRSLHEIMNYEMSSQIDLFHLREAPAPPKTTLQEALEQTQLWIESLRSWILANNVPVKDSIRLLGLANRFEMAGTELLSASRQAAALRLRLYLGDYVL
jgi:p-hydroxybenzoic acid efflux pump subunit AaeB